MIRTSLLLVFSILFDFTIAQKFSTLSGQVIDVKTNQAVPGATVYFAHTSIGVFANAEGKFVLDKIPFGKYDLTISMIGYKSISKPIEFLANSTRDSVFALEPKPTMLDSVTVKAKKIKVRYFDYFRFVKLFLGQTSNSKSCKILNPEDITVYNDGAKLIAEANKPIIVENHALGYNVYYDLKEFSFNSVIKLISISGVSRFEELTPKNDREVRKWNRERDRAFYGSTHHFLLSAIRNLLEINDFEIRNSSGIKLNHTDLFKDSLFYYPTKIYIIFKNEIPEIYYPLRTNTNSQMSDITFTGKPIKIYKNGYFENFYDIIFGGYFGWNSGVAEFIPADYKPSSKKK